jgi:cell wall assembly regulator SMI1
MLLPFVQAETIFRGMWSKNMNNEELWLRLEQQLCIHAPELAASLRPGADEATLIALEEIIGQKLPEDIRFAYLRHDGCNYIDLNALGIFNSSRWLPVKESLTEWETMCESIEGFTTADICSFDESDPLWHAVAIRPFIQPPKQWIPIGQGSGKTVYFDLLPGVTGVVNQVICQYAQSGSCSTWVIASSFKNHLQDLLLGVEQGLLVPMNYQDTMVGYWGVKQTKEEFKATSYLSVYPLG